MSRTEFEELLDRHNLFNEIHRTIRMAVNTSRERGYGEEDIRAVFMVGGSSQIPAVQRVVRQMFDKDRVMLDHPMDAVARGGAAFVAGVDFFDHIQHDYAIRFRSPESGDYDYRVVVPRGTAYPSEKPVARLSVKATYQGQTHLGIAIFEVGNPHGRRQPQGQHFELVFDPSGAARVMQVTPEEQERRTYFWMNEQNQTFLSAEPPAQPGEPRFEVEFDIDDNKHLLITARDMITNRLLHQRYPVVKLT
jgi:molecular chaperone DnaK (HSP70)